MYLIDRLVEARIIEAVARGEFDNLPGAGRPMALDPVFSVRPGEAGEPV